MRTAGRERWDVIAVFRLASLLAMRAGVEPRHKRVQALLADMLFAFDFEVVAPLAGVERPEFGAGKSEMDTGVRPSLAPAGAPAKGAPDGSSVGIVPLRAAAS